MIVAGYIKAKKKNVYRGILGTIKKFLAPVLWEWPRLSAEIVVLFLNIISTCLPQCISFPILFQFAYPFKIEAFFLVPQITHQQHLWCLHCFQIPTTKVRFQIWKKIEIWRGWILRIGGMRKDLEAAFSRAAIASSEVWDGAISCKSRTPQFIATDKVLFSSEKCWYLSYFSTKTYVVGTH